MRDIKELLLLAGLNVALGLTTYKWVQAEKRVSWLEGQWSVYQSFAVDGTEGTLYTDPTPKVSKRKSK